MIFAAFVLCLATSPCPAQTKNSGSSTFNLQKAYEVLQNDQDEEQALSLLDNQLKGTPDNAEALFLRAKILRNQKDYANAMRDINHAIRVNKPRKTGICNSTLHWTKSSLYNRMQDFENEIAELKTALSFAKKDNKDYVQDISFDLGQAYYALGRYAESDAVYEEMIKADETDQPAMAGLARNMIARKEYRDAAILLEKAKVYDVEYTGTYKFAMQAYMGLEDYDKAIDNAILLFEKDDDEFTDYMVKVFMKHKTYAVANIREKIRDSISPAAWKIVLANIYEESGEYEKALAIFDELEADFGKDPWLNIHKADCYKELGLVQTAIAEYDLALGKDYDSFIYGEKGSVYRGAGMYREAIEQYDLFIDTEPASACGYYAKGWCFELSGDDDTAMKFYNEGIDLDKSYPYIYLMRGQLFLKKGDRQNAESDFNHVLQLDTLVGGNSCRHYALHFLGRDDEAQEWMEKILADEPLDHGNWYDQACLFSRMGRLDEAVEALEKCLEMGYCKFGHIEHDDDLDAIRDREDFKSVVARYSSKLEERIASLREKVGEPKDTLITEVAISRRSGGTFEIPCTVNGLDLHMLFDTGASDVTISSVEANFMFKNDYLSMKDIKGKKYYQIANGDLSEGTVITLREVKVGDAVLRNVDASVVRSQKAPLLLGQSVLERFGTITIDNINSKLIIKQ